MEVLMRRTVLTIWMVLAMTATTWCGTYKDNGNGTVTDLATGLTWQQQDDNIERAWAAAGTYCQGLPLGGKSDWRLPNVNELQSIVDYRLTAPAIYGIAFPGTEPSLYWTATTAADDSEFAWFVSFNNGYVSYYGKSNTFYVRCVRSGQ
jgi:hypothetical protein